MSERGSDLAFAKLEGAGNDFIVIPTAPPVNPTAIVLTICDRRFGIGADGVFWLERCATTAVELFRAYGFNRDGTQMHACINGFRCAALFALKTGWSNTNFEFATARGTVRVDVQGSNIALELCGPQGTLLPIRLPSPSPAEIGYGIWSGDPHLVAELSADLLSEIDFVAAARPLRWWTGVSDAGSNVHFISKSSGGWQIRSFERGVEDETLACGSGCMAAALMISESRTDFEEIKFCTRGGGLIWVGRRGNVWRITGPTSFVFEGTWFGAMNVKGRK